MARSQVFRALSLPLGQCLWNDVDDSRRLRPDKALGHLAAPRFLTGLCSSDAAASGTSISTRMPSSVRT